MDIRDVAIFELIRMHAATRRLLGDDADEVRTLRGEIERRDRVAKESDAKHEAAKLEAVASD